MPKRLLRGLLLKPTLNLLNWILKRRKGNSLIIGGPLGWNWQATLDTTHHGSLAGPANAHRHSDLANIGIDDHHARDHATRHSSGGADAVTLDASQIGAGRFGMARMPAGTSGQVLTAQGAGVDPAYADSIPKATDWKGSFLWDTSVYLINEIDISALFSANLAETTRRKYSVYLDLTNVAADASFASLYLAVKTKVDGTNYRAIDRKTVAKADLAANAEPGIVISIPAVAENVQITMQMSTALGADATIYYAVVKEHLE